MSNYFTEEELKEQGLAYSKYQIVKHNKGDLVVIQNQDSSSEWSLPLEDVMFSLREVYYSSDDLPKAVSDRPIFYAYFNSEKELKDELTLVSEKIDSSGTIDFNKIGKYTNEPEQKKQQ